MKLSQILAKNINNWEETNWSQNLYEVLPKNVNEK